MNKVVPFERSVEYVRGRAALNRREGRLLDALGLMRRAVERKPEDMTYQMDLAETLCEMGCYAQSNRVLAQVLEREDAPYDCYFGLCCNFYGMNELEAAYHMMIRFLANQPDASERPEVSEMLRNIVLLRAFGEMNERRMGRAQKLLMTGRRYMRAGEPAKAERAFRKSMLAYPEKSDLARVMMAEALLLRGDAARAREETERLLETAGGDLLQMALCVSARACVALNDGARARALLTRAKALAPNGQATLLLLDALCDAREDEDVQALLGRLLRDAPYDKALLHTCAVNRLRRGEPVEQAIAFWTRMLRVDPQDDVAAYYLEQAEKGLENREMPYGYALPSGEIARRRMLLLRAMALPRAEREKMWRESATLMKLCRWAIRSQNNELILYGRGLLEDTDSAQALLREARLNPKSLDGQSERFQWIKKGQETRIVAIERDEMGLRAPLMYRKAMKLAVNAADEDVSSDIAQLQLRYLAAVGAPPRLYRAEGWAAALLCGAIREKDKNFTPEMAAERLGCSHRAAWRYIARLTQTLTKGVSNSDENHRC